MSTLTIVQLVEELSKLSVLDMSKLKSALEDAWGVKAAAAAGPVVMAAAAPAAETAESTEFQITLEATADATKKIGVIKVVREITGLGLKEAKDLVDGAPKELKASAAKAEAEDIKKKVEAAGGKVTLKGL
ncbi:MAG: 50S ribosomal protein L7/L12 [Rhabdochlamydiaceae bacterium]|nr:50S ribosomal protein L7/L12 [Rhabdochlamydiaceae bacterium]